MRRNTRYRVYVTLLRRRVQHKMLMSLLMIAGVTVAVAMVTSIDLASDSSLKALEFSTRTLRGNATHVITAHPHLIPAEIYFDLRAELKVRNSAPIVTDTVRVAQMGQLTMSLLGVDPIAEVPFRAYLGPASHNPFASALALPLIREPFSLLMREKKAVQYDLKPGDTLTLQYRDRVQDFTLLGYIDSAVSDATGALDHLLVTDISNAQSFLGRTDALDRIDLLIEAEREEQETQRIREWLPPAIELEAANQQIEAVRQLTSAFRLNLGALSLLAAVVSMFLIYNMLSFNVMKERRILGTLHALGMKRSQIFVLILLEATVIGLVGIVAGIALGYFLASRLVDLIAQSYGDLFFVETVRTIVPSQSTFLKSILIGMGCTLLGAVIPAFNATQIDVAHVMRGWGTVEDRDVPVTRFNTIALVLIMGGSVMLLPQLPLAITFAGIFALLIGCAFLVPVLLRLAIRICLYMTAGTRRPLLIMSLRQPLRRLGQSSIAVASLMLSLSVIIGIGTMVGSFRASVEDWMEQVFQADIYVTTGQNRSHSFLSEEPATVTGPLASPGVPPAILAELDALSGVAQVTTIYETELRSPVAGLVHTIVLSDDDAKTTRRYISRLPGNTHLWDEAIRRDAILVSQALAHQYDLAAGDYLPLVTRTGLHEYLIAGVMQSYEVVPTVFMDDSVYAKAWGTSQVSAAALVLAEGETVQNLMHAIEDVFRRADVELMYMLNQELRSSTIALFNRTFTITSALQVLAMLVSFMSILATLMSMMLDQARELATMRAVGMNRVQIGWLLVLEALVFGVSAIVLAIPLGLLLSLILIYVVNARSFGWSLEWSLQPWELGKALGVAITSALLGCIYPVWRLSHQLLLQSAHSVD